MAQVKITELTAQTDPSSSDVLPLVSVSDNETKKVTVADLLENAGDGTVSAPAFSFDSDKNTGIYRPGADQLAVSVGGSQALLVQSSGVTVPGDLTILGTTTTIETNDLVVEDKNIQLATVSTPSNSTADGGGITLKGATDKTITWVNSTGCWTFNQPMNFNDHVRIDSSGNVGIGATSLNNKLEVNGNQVLLANGQLKFADAGNSHVGVIKNSGTSGNGQLEFLTGGAPTEAMRITSSNNLGIGTSSPDNLLTVQGASNPQLKVSATNTGTNSAGLYIENQGQRNWQIWADRASDQLRIGNNSRAATNLSIDSSGRLLAGTSTSSSNSRAVFQANTADSNGSGIIRLARGENSPSDGDSLGAIAFTDSGHLTAAAIASVRDGGTWTSGSSQPARLIFTTCADGAITATERMRIDSSGNVGINTTSPAAKLHTVGTVLHEGDVEIRPENTGGEGGQITLKNPDKTSTGATIDVSSANAFRIFQLNNNSVMELGQLSGTGGLIKFATAGSERLRIDSSGKIGIGTSAPQSQLQVLDQIRVSNSSQSQGSVVLGDGGSTSFNVGIARWNGSSNAAGAGGIGYFSQGTGNVGGHYFYTGDAAAGSQTARMVILPGGNVGINTTSPNNLLEVRGTSSGQNVLHLSNSAGTSDGGAENQIRVTCNGNTNWGNLDIQAYQTIFTQNGSERMRIDSSGRLLMGSTVAGNADADNINVAGAGNVGITLRGSSSGTGNIFFADSTSGDDLKRGQIVYDHSGNSMRLHTNAVERLRIDSSGNVGIGISSPDSILNIADTSNVASIVKLRGARTSNGNNCFFTGLGSRGTIASPATLVANDVIATFNANAHDGTNYLSGGRLRFNVESISTGSLNSNITFLTNDGTSEAERLRINSSGNVGIGVSNPLTKLHLPNHSTIRFGESGAVPKADIAYSSTGFEFLDIKCQGTTNGYGNIRFYTGATPTERMLINSSGNVGIGTASPDRLVHIFKGDAGSAPSDSNTSLMIENSTHAIIQMASPNNFSSRILFGDPQDADAGKLLYDHANDSLQFYANASERMRINSSGRVGVGTTSMDGELEVRSANSLGIVSRSTSTQSTHTNKAFKARNNSGTDTFTVSYKGRGYFGAGLDVQGESVTFGPAGTTSQYQGLSLVNGKDSSAAVTTSYIDFRNNINGVDAHLFADHNTNGSSTLIFGTTPAGARDTDRRQERVRITDTGAVGIGTSSPSGRLEVTGGYATLRNGASSFPDGVSAPIIYGSTGGGSGTFNETGNLVLQSRSDSGSYNICMVTGDTPTERLRIDSAGFVGIGTNSPQRKFVVSDAGAEGFEFYPGSSDTGNTLNHYDRGSSAFIDITTNADQHIFGRADGEKMRIDSSGRVGIGTSSPTTALDIRGSSDQTVTIQTTTSGADSRINFRNSGGTDAGGIHYKHNGNYLAFNTGGSNTEQVRIDSSGRLLVGISSGTYGAATAHEFVGSNSDYIFSLTNDTASDSDGHRYSYLAFTGKQSGGEKSILASINGAHDGASDDTKGMLVFRTNSGSEGGTIPTERMRIASDGKISIGSTGDPSTASTDDPKVRLMPGEVSVVNHQSSSLHLNRTGNNGSIAKFFRGGTQVGKITVDASSTSYVTSSDYRLKENVVELADGITRVKQLAPKRFNFIVDADTTVDGFLAHEAQAVVPEAVVGEKDGEEMQGIDQSKLVPLLTAALQEAIAKIETLEQRLTDAGL